MKKNKKPRKRPIPIVDKCVCGKPVLNHHWLCDVCYKEQKKLQVRIDKAKLLKNEMILKKELDKYGKWVDEHYNSEKAKAHWEKYPEHNAKKHNKRKKKNDYKI